MKKLSLAVFLGLIICMSVPCTIHAQNNGAYTNVTNAIRYKLIGQYDIDRLNNILNNEIPEAVGEKNKFSAPKNAVKLYRVEYTSVIPEQNNRPTIASGLLAIPVTPKKNLPVVSYQHGTVFDKEEVPSFPDKSFETRLMIAQFAAQGYIVIGADYFGMGTSTENDGYMVMKSQQQACYDMMEASKAILSREGISMTDFFVTGWSQGAVVSMAFLEKLEATGVAVTAAGTASAQCDGYIMTNGFLNFPRKIDAPWVSTMFILTVFSFENYYQIPGLAKGFFTAEQYGIAERLYKKDATIKPEEFPTDLHKLIRPEFFNPVYYKESAYGKLISEMHPYRWVVKTPIHMYYGDIDECLTIGLAKLPMDYQKALGNTKVEAFSAGADANHRKTFGRAAPEWKTWFDALVAGK